MAKPYLDGKFWAMRRRFDGHEVFVSGCARGAAAKKMDARVQELTFCGKPRGLGPYHTTFAQALQDYALERLPFLKGAVQEASLASDSLLSRLRLSMWHIPAKRGKTTVNAILRIGAQSLSVGGSYTKTKGRTISSAW